MSDEDKEQKSPSWSQLAALGLFAERVHSFLKGHSPHYSQFVEDSLEYVKRRLRLKTTLWDEVIRFMDTDKLEWHGGYQHHIQRRFAGAFLFEKLKPERGYRIKSGVCVSHNMDAVEDEMVKVDLMGVSMADPSLMSLKMLTIPTFVADLKIVPEEGKWADVLWPQTFLCFCRYGDIPVALWIEHEADYDRDGIYILAPRDKSDELQELLKELTEFLSGKNPYPKSVISMDWFNCMKFNYERDQTLSLRYYDHNVDPSLFSPDVSHLVFEDIPGFLAKQDALCEKGFDGRRSYLLAGPPGTGKTNIIKAIISRLPDEFPAFVVGARNLNYVDNIREYPFMLPSLFVIEDIDLILERDKERQLLLNFLDGITSPKKMVVVMTTNHIEKLGNALRNRPGRIDRICYVLPGEADERAAQIRILTEGIALPASCEDIAEYTDGMTFAQHREVIRRAIIYSATADSITLEAMHRSLDECRRQFADEIKEVHGFQEKASTILPVPTDGVFDLEARSEK